MYGTKDGEKLIKKHPQIDLLIGTAHVNGFKEILVEYLTDKGERVYNSLEVKESESRASVSAKAVFRPGSPLCTVAIIFVHIVLCLMYVDVNVAAVSKTL